MKMAFLIVPHGLKKFFLGSGASGGISMASDSTAIGVGNIMFYPISAPNTTINGSPEPNPKGTGYMTVWNMSNWKYDASTSQSESILVYKKWITVYQI